MICKAIQLVLTKIIRADFLLAFLIAIASILSLTTGPGNAATNPTVQLKSVAITDAAGTNKAPTAIIDFTKNDDIYTFDASKSSDSDGSIVSYKWFFEDGTTYSGNTTNYKLSSNSTVVILTVVDDKGGASVVQDRIQRVVYDVTVDNMDPAFSFSGPWKSWSNYGGFIGSNYLTTVVGTTTESTEERIALWKFEIPIGGNYIVYCNYPNSQGWFSTFAPYEIINNDIVISTVGVNQRVNGGKLFPLGEFVLKPGSLTVRLSSEVATYKLLTADAVRVTSIID